MPNPNKGESRAAFVSRCMGDPESRKSFPDQKQRAAVCYSKYDNKSNSAASFLAINASSSGTYRIEKHAGSDYIVVPVVALVEGVIQGVTAEQPELALAEEFGRFPASWNGRPITIDHPYITVQGDGTSEETIRVSASSSPDVLEDFQVGFIFNTRLRESKLTMEAWLDPVKMNGHSEAARHLLQKIKAGEKVEVSTGLFTNTEQAKGEFKGEEYFSKWSGVVPDHLALLPGELVGACSIEDGCGANVTANQFRIHKLRPSLTDSACGCGGTCEQCGGPPMTTSNASPGAKATRPVTSSLNSSGATDPAALSSLWIHEDGSTHFLTNVAPDGMLDGDARNLLQQALDEEDAEQTNGNGSGGSYPQLMGYTNDHVVYNKYDRNTGRRKTFRRSAKIAPKSKKVTMGDDEQEVNLTTTITPRNQKTGGASARDETSDNNPTHFSAHSSTTQENAMTTTPSKVTANDARTFLADFVEDPSKLPQMADDVVLKLHARITAGLEKQSKTAVDTALKAHKDANPPPAQPKPPATAEEYLAQAPAGVRESLEAGMRMHAKHKADLIKNLTAAGARCKFTPEQLNSFDVAMLENLVELARVPTFEGRAPAQEITANMQQVPEADLAQAPPPPRLGIVNKTSTTTSQAAA